MSSSPTLLLVEDDDSLREIMTFNLEEAGWQVVAVATGSEALEVYDAQAHDLVITDVRLPDIDGLEVLSRIRETNPKAVVLVITAHGSLDRAVEAMQRGAFHYIEKPVNSRALEAILARALEHGELLRQNERLQQGESAEAEVQDQPLVTASPAMTEVLRLVDRVADSDAAVLIRGESGTGKELVARALHQRSYRSDEAFVAVNCAAIPEELLESVLFGHQEGAFTGASSTNQGKFRAADGGTLFLDEIGEMSPRLQSKLLRVLQQGEVDVVGASRPVRVNVRIVAATHQDLSALIEEDRFREDLYYRLNVVPVDVPPLRKRREDIPVLVRYFLRKYSESAITVDREVDEQLLAYDWPGNVRELKNLVQRIILLRDDDHLTVDDLPAAVRSGNELDRSPGVELPFALPAGGLDLRQLEKAVITAALKKMDGNQSATARYLNIPRHILLYRLEKYGIDTD